MYLPARFGDHADMSGVPPAQAVNTSVTLVHICQNLRFTFSFLDNTYLSLVLVSTSGISMVTFWYIQRQWKIDSKKMARRPSVFLFYFKRTLDTDTKRGVLVHGDKRGRDSAHPLGNDRYLDNQVRVCPASSSPNL